MINVKTISETIFKNQKGIKSRGIILKVLLRSTDIAFVVLLIFIYIITMCQLFTISFILIFTILNTNWL